MSECTKRMSRRQAMVWELLGDSWDENGDLNEKRQWVAEILGIPVERAIQLEQDAAERIHYDFHILESRPELDP